MLIVELIYTLLCKTVRHMSNPSGSLPLPLLHHSIWFFAHTNNTTKCGGDSVYLTNFFPRRYIWSVTLFTCLLDCRTESCCSVSYSQHAV